MQKKVKMFPNPSNEEQQYYSTLLNFNPTTDKFIANSRTSSDLYDIFSLNIKGKDFCLLYNFRNFTHKLAEYNDIELDTMITVYDLSNTVKIEMFSLHASNQHDTVSMFELYHIISLLHKFLINELDLTLLKNIDKLNLPLNLNNNEEYFHRYLLNYVITDAEFVLPRYLYKVKQNSIILEDFVISYLRRLEELHPSILRTKRLKQLFNYICIVSLDSSYPKVNITWDEVHDLMRGIKAVMRPMLDSSCRDITRMSLDELLEYEYNGGECGTTDLSSELALRLETAKKYLKACVHGIKVISSNDNIYGDKDTVISISEIENFLG